MKISNEIFPVHHDDYLAVIDVWEASVRATHHFLSDDDIQSLKPLILSDYLDMVTLACMKEEGGGIIGFLGVADQKIEMLFVDPDFHRKDVGSKLLRHAIGSMRAWKVDVNEQNEQAVEFYKHMGFEVVDRSPLDGQGKPFPLLHMELSR